ncbi:MAG: YqaJ viral recombinase family protein [Candidatus Paceibacterota bacterium]
MQCSVDRGGIITIKMDDADGETDEEKTSRDKLTTAVTPSRSLQSHVKLIEDLSDLSIVGECYPSWVQSAALIAWQSVRKYYPAFSWSLAKTARVIYDSYHVDDAEFRRIAMLPQRSTEWLRIRNGWVDLAGEMKEEREGVERSLATATATATATIVRAPLVSSSVAGDILSHSDAYKSDKDKSKVLTNQVWSLREAANTFGLLAMQRGTACEPMIMEEVRIFIEDMVRRKWPRAIVTIREVGLQVCCAYPYQAASPDGIIDIYDPDSATKLRWGLEMKCRPDEGMQPYEQIKPSYYDQIQHTMGVLGMDEYVFACHSAESISIEVFDFNAELWAAETSIIQNYYWKYLWPCTLLKALGVLVEPRPAPAVDATNETTRSTMARKTMGGRGGGGGGGGGGGDAREDGDGGEGGGGESMSSSIVSKKRGRAEPRPSVLPPVSRMAEDVLAWLAMDVGVDVYMDPVLNQILAKERGEEEEDEERRGETNKRARLI